MEYTPATPDRPPKYAEAIETLLQTPFFVDDERAEMLYRNPYALEEADVRRRMPVYQKGLRVLAKRRSRVRSTENKPIENVQSWNQEWSDNLTIRQIGIIASIYSSEVDEAREQMEAIHASTNAAETAIASGTDSEAHTSPRLTDELFPLQHTYVNDILEALRLPPKVIKRRIRQDEEARAYSVHGVVGVGPTGFGKTAVMGEIANRQDIGKPCTIGEVHRRKRLLIVAPSVQLVEQFAGLSGDKTFLRFARTVSITPYVSYTKDLRGDAIVTTNDQFVEGFKDGHFFGTPIDLLMFDESHHLTEPLIEATFLTQWQGKTIGFTATPDYHADKDARSLLPNVVCHIDLLGSIEANITNGAQIFTIFVDCKDLQGEDMTPRERRLVYRARRDEAIVEFLTPLLDEGRRALVFCDQGNFASNAIAMADALSELSLPSGRPIAAEAMHSYRSFRRNSQDIINRFHNREIDVLTTVETGVESLNIDVDVVTVNAVYSHLKLRQQIGRGTRPSKRFPVTIYAQFIVPFFGARFRTPPYTLYQAFGLEEVEQAKVLLPAAVRENCTEQKDAAINLKIAALSHFSPKLQEYMAAINFRTIGEVLLGTQQQTEIPAGYISFDSIPRATNTSASVARSRLDAAGYSWVGRYESGRRGMVRYYEPQAATYFTKNPLPPLAESHLSIGDLADKYSVSYRTMRRKIEESNIPTVELQGKASSGLHVDTAHVPYLERIIEAEMPLRQPGDISSSDLAAEFGLNPSVIHRLCKEHTIKPMYRRDPENTSGRSTKMLLSKEQADQIRASFHAHPVADGKQDTSRAQLMARLGIKTQTELLHYLSDEEKAQMTVKWGKAGNGFTRAMFYWTNEQADAIAARLESIFGKQIELPAHMIPYNVSAERFAASWGTIHKRLTNPPYHETIASLAISSSRNKRRKCIPWTVLEDLEKSHFKLKPEALPIDYSRLPVDANDIHPERVAYARYIQSHLVAPHLLGFDPTPYLEQILR